MMPNLTANSDKESVLNTKVQKFIDAPDGTSIKDIYDNNRTHTGYMVTMGENIGIRRIPVERAEICMDIMAEHNISWTLSDLTGTKDFRTPIDMVTVYQDSRPVLRQRLSDNIIWNENPQSADINPVMMDIYPDMNVVKYNLSYKNEEIILTTDTEKSSVPVVKSSPYSVCIGIVRSDLLRWRGSVVPKQSVNINHIQMYSLR